ncbi:MAG: SxtJ family membrane protein [Candidatus Omnitrophica bacterium]|nr:SxtJ family membrane protein [Candidatus Omnitrophota bacterium]
MYAKIAAVWMYLSLISGWINARIILIVMFCLIFTPVGLLMRLFRDDLLERKIKRGHAERIRIKQHLIFQITRGDFSLWAN